MKKVLRNISLNYLITAIVFLGLISMVLIGFTGYAGINNINQRVNSMYYDAVIPSQQASDINNKFMNIRVESLRIIDMGYNPSIVNNIKQLDGELREQIREYLEAIDDETDRSLTIFTNIMRLYDQYMTAWQEIEEKLIAGEEIVISEQFTLDSRANSILSNLNHVML